MDQECSQDWIRTTTSATSNRSVLDQSIIDNAMSNKSKSCTNSVTTTVIETITYTIRDTANVGSARTSYDASGTTLVDVAGEFSPSGKTLSTKYCGAKPTAKKTKRSLMAFFRSLAASRL